MSKNALGAPLIGFLFCLPCLAVLVGAAGGLALASAVGGWLTDNALLAALGLVVLLPVVLAGLVYWSRRRAACEVPTPPRNHTTSES